MSHARHARLGRARHARSSKHARSHHSPVLAGGLAMIAAVAAVAAISISTASVIAPDRPTSPPTPVATVKPAAPVTTTAPPVIVPPAPPTRVVVITPPPAQVIVITPAPPRVVLAAPAPNAGNTVVSVSRGASQHRSARAVVELLTNYFSSINEHDYQLYRQVQTRAAFNADPRKWTLAGFMDGFGSTTDSQIRLREIGTAADGRLTATVSFISRQAASAGSGQTCTHWTITRFLRTEDSRLRIDTNPGNPTRHFAC